MTYQPRPTSRTRGLQRRADDRRVHGTRAEQELERVLNEVGGGVLRDQFQREWVYGGRWIIDFYFREIRLGVEVDGGYHSKLKQQIADIDRELALEKAGITLVRISNEEVFGDRDALLQKLREAWRNAQAAARASAPRRKGRANAI